MKKYPEPGMICTNFDCWKKNKKIINRLLAIEILMNLIRLPYKEQAKN